MFRKTYWRSNLKRGWGVLTLVLILLVTAGILIASAGESMTVSTRGDNIVHPNTMISSNLRFSPGPVTVASGGTVTWVHADDTEEPHTVSVVEQSDLGDTFEEVFACFNPGSICDQILTAHFTFGPVLDAFGPGNPAAPEFNEVGDSIFFGHGQSVEVTITAPSGTSLYYLCAIHPWMQGVIQVK